MTRNIYPEARRSGFLLKSGPVIGSQAINLRLRQFRGDNSHSSIDIIAPLARGIHLQLQDNVLLHLLGKNGRFDRTARARPMTRRARRNVAARDRQARPGARWRRDGLASVAGLGLRFGWAA